MPAGATYEPIATNTLSTTTATVTFSSISASYTDLILVSNNVKSVAAGATMLLRFNNDTSALYSHTELYGNGTTAASARTTSGTVIPIQYFVGVGTANEGVINITHIMNYSNTTTNKTILARENNAPDPNSPGTGAIVGLWRNTAAINRIDILSSSSFTSGSTFTLYGIKAA